PPPIVSRPMPISEIWLASPRHNWAYDTVVDPRPPSEIPLDDYAHRCFNCFTGVRIGYSRGTLPALAAADSVLHAPALRGVRRRPRVRTAADVAGARGAAPALQDPSLPGASGCTGYREVADLQAFGACTGRVGRDRATYERFRRRMDQCGAKPRPGGDR